MSRGTNRQKTVASWAGAGAIGLFLCSCVATPDHCKSPAEAKADTRPRQARLLENFDSRRLGAPGKEFTVFAPKRTADHRGGPPVMVLHEMPALSPDVLDLALRLSREGYSVYVPLLWGAPDENAASKFLFVRRALQLRSSPEWRAAAADVERPIVGRLASLSQVISGLHRGKRVGVIGNCVTGILPFALAARVPEIAAPIASQPTLPLTLSKRASAHTGLAASEIAALHRRVETEPTFQLLGLRFEEDNASPAERFRIFKGEFPKAFIDGTIPVERYHCRDRLGRHVHAVLTSCYSNDKKSATYHVWRETVNFLEAKLSGDEPRRYAFREP